MVDQAVEAKAEEKGVEGSEEENLGDGELTWKVTCDLGESNE